MHVNPEIDECFALRGWYDNSGAQQSFKAHANTGGGGSSYTFKREDVRSLDEIKEAEYGRPDKPENFCARATIMHIKGDNIVYPACPTSGCNKKVIEMGDSWRCEKCNQSFAKPEYRYVTITQLSGLTGN